MNIIKWRFAAMYYNKRLIVHILLTVLVVECTSWRYVVRLIGKWMILENQRLLFSRVYFFLSTDPDGILQ